MQPNIFARITKVDEAKREVWGRAVEEVPDLSDEIFDYASSKPYFEAWSKKFADATDGKSLGNIRAMHGNVAAGKAISLDFNDPDKAIDIGTKVVDDNEWAKVLEGVYTGFSIGGKYVGEKKTEKAANGKDVRRYTADPIEISLVDSPCIPTCKYFDIVKADGSTLQKLFKGAEPEPVVEPVADPAKPAEPKVVEVKGSDDDVAKFADALNTAGLTLADAIALVTAAAAAKAAEAEPKAAEPVVEPAAVVEPTEAEPAKADPVVEIIVAAAKTGELIKRVNDPELSVIGLAKIAEEELTEEERAPLKSLDDMRAAIVAKAGARHSKSDKQLLQTAHDHLVALGADCDGDMDADKVKPAGDLNKTAPTDDLSKQLADALARIKVLEDQPMPRPTTVGIKTVSKSEDRGDGDQSLFTEADLIKNDDGSVNMPATMVKVSQRLGGMSAQQAR